MYASDSVIDGDINVIVQYYNTFGSVIRDHQTITISMDPCYLNIIDGDGNHMEIVSGSDTCATQNANDLAEGTLSFYVEVLHDGCPNVFQLQVRSLSWVTPSCFTQSDLIWSTSVTS